MKEVCVLVEEEHFKRALNALCRIRSQRVDSGQTINSAWPNRPRKKLRRTPPKP